MPIVLAELKMYKSLTVSDGSTNGGRMSANQVVSGALANLFPAVTDAERIAGSTKYRKAFLKVAHDGALTLYNGQVYMERPSPGEDAFTFWPATQTDTQAAITGSERRYGVGTLKTSVSAGASVLVVEVEPGNTGIYVNADTCRVTDKTTLVDAGGNVEFRTISGVPSVAGNDVTITFSEPLTNAFLASVTRVMPVYAASDVIATLTNFVVTSAGSGDYTSASITLNGIGTIEQTWTLTFTSATNFGVVGDTVGALAGGTVGGGSAPNNPDFTKPYYTMPAGGFSGVWASGDTIVDQSHPAAIPIWVRRVVPAGADEIASNTASIRLRGERV